MKDKIFNFLLVLTILVLIAILGIFGFVMYNEISGNGSLEFTLSEAGYPTIEYKETKEEVRNVNTNTDENLFSEIKNTEENNNTEFKSRFLYNQLNSDSKLIYDKLYANIDNLKTGMYTIEFGNVFLETLSQKNGYDILQSNYQSAIEAFLYENPEAFFLNATKMYINIEKITKITGVRYNVYINSGKQVNYFSDTFFSKDDVDKSFAEIEQIKEQIIAETYGMSDYEKIRKIHNYLIDTIDYDRTVSANNIYDIYGALVNKVCVCEGYAKAFQYLMNQVEIENAIVIGVGTNSNGNTENHAWNYVKLDGNWYAVDVTWDDPIIVGGGKLSNKSRYQYFLKGSETMNQNHTESKTFTTGGQEFTYPVLSEKDYK